MRNIGSVTSLPPRSVITVGLRDEPCRERSFDEDIDAGCSEGYPSVFNNLTKRFVVLFRVAQSIPVPNVGTDEHFELLGKKVAV